MRPRPRILGGALQESGRDGGLPRYRGIVGTQAGGEGVDEAHRGSQEEDRARSFGETPIG